MVHQRIRIAVDISSHGFTAMKVITPRC